MTHDGPNRTEHPAHTVRAMAQQLLELLRRETLLLTQGNHGGLLGILPEKEALARRISQSLRDLLCAEPSSEPAGRDWESWGDLKEMLLQIEALNDANGRYIEDLLSVYQELISIMVPQTYGRGTRNALPVLKGCGLSTEA